MKINVTGVCEVDVTKVVPSSVIIDLIRPIAGKKAIIDIDATATCADLIVATRAAFGISPVEVFVEVSVKRGISVLNNSKTLNELSVRDDANLNIHFKYAI